MILLFVTALLGAISFPYSMPAEVLPLGQGVWALVPIGVSPDGFSAVEAQFDTVPADTPLVRLASIALPVAFDARSRYLRAVFPQRSRGDTVFVRGGTAPSRAAFDAPVDGTFPVEMPEETLDRPHYTRKAVLPESPSPVRGLSWLFRGDSLPPPWLTCQSLVLSSSPLSLFSDGSGTVATDSTWQGLPAHLHPVLIVQMRAGSGIGSGEIEWTTDRGLKGAMVFPMHPRADWTQAVLRPFRSPAWRGMVTSLSIRPLDHPGIATLEWIQMPALPRFWAMMLSSMTARWVVIAAVFVTSIALLRRSANGWVAGLGALCATAAITVVAIPFPELLPGLRCASVTAPWHTAALGGIAAWGSLRWRRKTDVVSLMCIAVILLHGALVAKGAGMTTGVALASAPLAFMAGSTMGRKDIGRALLLLVAGAIAALGLHAALLPVPGRDPVYGALLLTLGRAFWDLTAEGRGGGAFVHPLVLSTVTAAVGSALLATPPKSRGRLALGLTVLASGVSGVSRAFLAMSLVTAVWLLRRRPFALLLVVVAGIAICLVTLTGSQGLLRDLHAERRAVGLKVAGRTLIEKPLQGVGWGQYERAARRFGPRAVRVRPHTTPDNTYLRLLTEGGLVGGGAFIGWLVTVGLTAARGRQRSWVPAALPVLGLFVMWGVFDGAYWQAATVPPMLCIGLAAGMERGS